MNVAMNEKTEAVEFEHIPADDINLLTVVAGNKPYWALAHAESLDNSVVTLLTAAITQGEMDADIAWLCRFAMHTACALRESVGVSA